MPRKRSWSDDDLREAVEASTTMKEVVERLRLAHGGAAYTTVRTRIEILEVDTAHFTRRSREALRWKLEDAERDRERVGAFSRRRWWRQDLATAVARATSLHGVFRQLGLAVGGSQWLVMRQLVLAGGYDTSHWDHALLRRERQPDWTDDDLREVLPQCRSIRQIQIRLGITPNGSQHAKIKQRIAALDLDDSHMTGRAWRRGRELPSPSKRPLDEILVRDSDYRNTTSLKKRLLEAGLREPECEHCRRAEWRGDAIPLELDHVNGDRTDNRLENLRLLCPNCHARTETYCGRNKGRYAELETGGDNLPDLPR